MADEVTGVFNVNKQLHGLLVPVVDLHEDPDNSNGHDGKSTNAIAASYKKFKQQRPIVCNANGKVIAGNGQLEAARDILEWTHIACIRFDDEREAVQMAFAIADNKTAEFSSWNFPNLSEAFVSLQNESELLDATGFEEFEIQNIVEPNFGPASEDDQGKLDTETDKTIECPHCNERFRP